MRPHRPQKPPHAAFAAGSPPVQAAFLKLTTPSSAAGSRRGWSRAPCSRLRRRPGGGRTQTLRRISACRGTGARLPWRRTRPPPSTGISAGRTCARPSRQSGPAPRPRSAFRGAPQGLEHAGGAPRPRPVRADERQARLGIRTHARKNRFGARPVFMGGGRPDGMGRTAASLGGGSGPRGRGTAPPRSPCCGGHGRAWTGGGGAGLCRGAPAFCRRYRASAARLARRGAAPPAARDSRARRARGGRRRRDRAHPEGGA